MAAPTEYEVDPSIAGGSGTGTHGDPFGDLQFALDSITQGAGGDRVSVWDSADEVLAASLTNLTYGVPTDLKPLIIEGMTATGTPGDGGIGGIDCNAGAIGVFSGVSVNNVTLKNMRVHNAAGVTQVVQVAGESAVINCEIDNVSATSVINPGGNCVIMNNYVHNCSGIGLSASTSTLVLNNRFEDGVKKFTTAAVRMASAGGTAIGNYVSVSGATDGINLRAGCSAIHNSIYSAGGTGQGIDDGGGANEEWNVVANNIFEGFSGVGGIGIDNSSTAAIHYCDGNRFFNCTTNITATARILAGNTANTTLTVSAFTNAPTDFTPVNTDGIFNAALPGKVGLF